MAEPKGKKVLDVDIYARNTEGCALHEQHCQGTVRQSYTPRHSAELALALTRQQHLNGLNVHRPQVPLSSDMSKNTRPVSVTSTFRIRTSEGKGAAFQARTPCSLHSPLPLPADNPSATPLGAVSQGSNSTLNMHHHSLRLIARFLRRQLGLQQAHSPLQIHARVRIGNPLKVLLYLLRDLLQTLR
jgi:hypothetical protein